jgi:hypothetical protein
MPVIVFTSAPVKRSGYVENGAFGDTLEESTFTSSFLAFFTAFFAFFAVFRASFVFLDIRCGPPIILARVALSR